MRLLLTTIAALALLTVTLLPAPVCVIGATPAAANNCTKRCRDRHNSCRIRTKGSPRCDAKLRQCLSRCVR